MKTLSLVLAVLILALSLSLALTACSGGADPTEAPTEATEVPTLIQTQPATSEEDVAKNYVPLTMDNVGDYLDALYAFDHMAMDNIKIREGDNNNVVYEFQKDGLFYVYNVDKTTGKILEKYEGEQEKPVLKTEPTTAVDVAQAACFKTLEGYDGTVDPENISCTYSDETDFVTVACTWKGVQYLFEYDKNTGEVEQKAP